LRVIAPLFNDLKISYETNEKIMDMRYGLKMRDEIIENPMC
jgi:hypothetical protein